MRDVRGTSYVLDEAPEGWVEVAPTLLDEPQDITSPLRGGRPEGPGGGLPPQAGTDEARSPDSSAHPDPAQMPTIFYGGATPHPKPLSRLRPPPQGRR